MSQRVSLHLPRVPYLLPLSTPSLVLALTDSTAGGLPLRPGGARFIISCREGYAMLSNRAFFSLLAGTASDSRQPVCAGRADLGCYHFFVSIAPHPPLFHLITLYKIKAGVRYRPTEYKVLKDACAFRDGPSNRTQGLRLRNIEIHATSRTPGRLPRIRLFSFANI